MSSFGVRRERLPHGAQSFFAPLKSLGAIDREHVLHAYRMSEAGHYRQGMRINGEPAFSHPKGAAEIYINELRGRDPQAIIVLLLHDIQEDTDLLSYHRIARNFDDDVAYDVEALTKLAPGKETTKEYLERIIARGAWAILAKLCDRLHNLRTLAACDEKMQDEQLAETVRYHLPMLIPSLRTHGREWVAFADTLEQLILNAIKNLAESKQQKNSNST